MNSAKRVVPGVLGTISGLLALSLLLRLFLQLFIEAWALDIVVIAFLAFLCFVALSISSLLIYRAKFDRRPSTLIRMWMKVIGWTSGMAAGVVMITDGKLTGEHAGEHVLLGAIAGFLLGCLFAWELRSKAPRAS
jgi:hypothetical protein